MDVMNLQFFYILYPIMQIQIITLDAQEMLLLVINVVINAVAG
jgi:hypothetical protein